MEFLVQQKVQKNLVKSPFLLHLRNTRLAAPEVKEKTEDWKAISLAVSNSLILINFMDWSMKKWHLEGVF